VTSPELHHHARVAAVEAAATGPWDRPALRTRWEAIEKAAYEHPAELPEPPAGTPI
jgi:hypothetical protein